MGFRAIFGFFDFLSDVIFAVQLTDIFIIFPMGCSFMQLLRANKNEWVHYVHLRNWMSKQSYFLYGASVLMGSAFNSISLFNSQALRLPLFSMGLTKRQLIM